MVNLVAVLDVVEDLEDVMRVFLQKFGETFILIESLCRYEKFLHNYNLNFLTLIVSSASD